MRTAILALLLTTISWSLCAQDSFHAEGVSVGKTVIWFRGSNVETTFDGTLELAGTLQIGDGTHSYTASGPSFGSGIGDTVTLAVTLWVSFEAVGMLDSGEPIALRGGMVILGEDADLTTLSIGAGNGSFFLIVELTDATAWISGSLTTTAAGAFVPADDPVTMQIEGTGTFTFAGAEVAPSESLIDVLPWDPTSWPPEQHGALLALLLGIEPAEEPAQAD